MSYVILQTAERERLESELAALREDQLNRWHFSNELSRYRALRAREEQQLECAARSLRGEVLGEMESGE